MQMTDTDLPLSGRQPSLEKVWTIAKAVKCRDKMQNQNHQKDSEDILYLVNPGKMEKRNFQGQRRMHFPGICVSLSAGKSADRSGRTHYAGSGGDSLLVSGTRFFN